MPTGLLKAMGIVWNIASDRNPNLTQHNVILEEKQAGTKWKIWIILSLRADLLNLRSELSNLRADLLNLLGWVKGGIVGSKSRFVKFKSRLVKYLGADLFNLRADF